MIFFDTLQALKNVICNNNYLADIFMVCGKKDFIRVIRFQRPKVYDIEYTFV